MRRRSFQRRAIGHDDARQIGQVLFPEEGQGQPPQLFRQRNAPHPAFGIGCEIGRVILDVGCPKNQKQAYGNSGGVKHDPAMRHRPAHQVVHEKIQKRYRQHEHQIGQGTGQERLDHIIRALSGQGVFVL